MTDKVETGQAENKGGNGGNVVFIPGSGAKGSECPIPIDGSFIFKMADGSEVLRLDPDGAVYVRRERIDTDRELLGAFREWVRHATAEMGEGCTVVRSGDEG